MRTVLSKGEPSEKNLETSKRRITKRSHVGSRSLIIGWAGFNNVFFWAYFLASRL